MRGTIKNGLLTGGVLSFSGGREPTEYGDREHRYFAPQTGQFAGENAKYSGDYFSARAQGIFPGDPDEWTDVKIRLADVVRPSAAITRHFDDYKALLVAQPKVDYVRPGTKFECMGSTWIAVNPANISSPVGHGIVQRCNAVWRYLDWYGNVKSEPLIVEKLLANASDSDAQESGLITKGFFNVLCQCNDATRQLDTNSRLILGTGAYRITGYSDFQQEFTGDYDSVRLLEFTVRYEEPNEAIDDMERHVAGGKAFSWEITATAKNTLRPGETVQIAAESRRNGEVVESSAEHPISYFYTSSAPWVASVGESGAMTAVSEGDAEITVSMTQNGEISEKIAVSVESVSAQPHVEFLSTLPQELNAYESVEISAAYFENGEQTDEPVMFAFDGANTSAYSADVDGNTVTLRCWGGSVEPLTVTARHHNLSISEEISLKGV